MAHEINENELISSDEDEKNETHITKKARNGKSAIFDSNFCKEDSTETGVITSNFLKN